MKKISVILHFFIVAFLLASCATSKQARISKRTIDGKWKLQTITTQGVTAGQVKIQLFNEADYNCFTGGEWSFNARNSLGTYTTTNSAGCSSLTRDFRWSIYENGADPLSLQFKRLDANLKPMDNGDGFRLAIIQLDNNNMQLRSTVLFENRQVNVIYNFVRM